MPNAKSIEKVSLRDQLITSGKFKQVGEESCGFIAVSSPGGVCHIDITTGEPAYPPRRSFVQVCGVREWPGGLNGDQFRAVAWLAPRARRLLKIAGTTVVEINPRTGRIIPD